MEIINSVILALIALAMLVAIFFSNKKIDFLKDELFKQKVIYIKLLLESCETIEQLNNTYEWGIKVVKNCNNRSNEIRALSELQTVMNKCFNEKVFK